MMVRLCVNSDNGISGRIEDNGDVINILEFPFLDSRPSGSCQHGEEVLVLDGKPGREGRIYLFVETAKGIRGWISDHYIDNQEYQLD
jgi:hypothetical protein